MIAPNRVRVWDLPTRLFHWLLVALFAVSWWSAENREMEWHYRSGTLLLMLLAFRLVWGVIGGSTARFSHFLPTPRRLLTHFQADPEGTVRAGHNPLGALSVVAILLLLAVQIGTGLFAGDVDGLESGPLNYLVTFEQGRAAAEIHELAFNGLLALAGLHILAILYYQVIRRRNLIGPMVTGKDTAVAGDSALVPAAWWKLVLALAIALALGWWINAGAPLGAA
ncbi:MAG TPA: cytochrome b/b6 domain-containing protein [Novosphingobium sp.]